MEPHFLDTPAPSTTRKIYTVSELTKGIKVLLEERYPLIWVAGELSNLRVPASGHAYFSLKDEKAAIAAVMFRGQLRQLRFELEDGMTILAMGRVSVYEPRGSYQLIIEYAEPKGAGALQIAFEQLKRKLSAQGLFDEEHKQPLPYLPTRLAVLTSPSGAVIQDILNIIGRRFPNLAIDLYPVRVQGELAAAEVAHAIEMANRRSVNDIIILARGGGSLEDLAPFNTEIVARAIADSAIPIVSAIGHETDFTIADFVADLRAPTPSAAAELTVPVKSELQARSLELKQRCLKAASGYINQMRGKIESLARLIPHPGRKLTDARLHLDHQAEQLLRNIQDILRSTRLRFTNLQLAVSNNNPIGPIAHYRSHLKLLRFKMQQSMFSISDASSARLKKADALINALNPHAVLQRGYSITRSMPEGHLVMDAEAVKNGQLLEIQLASGCLKAVAQKPNHNGREE